MNSRTLRTPRRAARRVPAALAVMALPALAALALLTGCGGGGGSSAPTVITPVVPTPPTPPTPVGASVSASAPGGFTATLTEDRSGIAVGGTVGYTFTLANTSAAAATVVAGAVGTVRVPIAALRVSDPTGATAYPPISQPGVRPLDTPPAPPDTGTVTLQPGQSLTLTRILSVFGSAGTYQAVATFTVAASATDAPQTVTLGALPVVVK